MHTTNRLGAPPMAAISTRDGMTTLSTEIDFRMDRLAGEANRTRRAGLRFGIRHLVGHCLIALGMALHGGQPVHGGQPATRAESVATAR
jgi:hypothetical protein